MFGQGNEFLVVGVGQLQIEHDAVGLGSEGTGRGVVLGALVGRHGVAGKLQYVGQLRAHALNIALGLRLAPALEITLEAQTWHLDTGDCLALGYEFLDAADR